jgi:predicted nucleotidyltransferase
MTRDEVIATLRAHRADLEAMNVTSVALIGSVARGEAGPESDIDILIEHKRGLTLLDLGRIKNMLDSWIGRNVDLVTRPALRPAIRHRILEEAVDAWT